ncbi:hypothetical protein QOZ80_5AG0383590 [Eleusine coracana subsp. coracana]|nr:hypothetical protein QOZ80_5AG0383590 [Eleusine coracana subsp. coracana]
MTSLCSLTDDLLAEIFLRLPTLADVGRAATVCTAFRRVVADHAFLRRLHCIHPAPLFGFLSSGSASIYFAEPPHSSAPYAQPLEHAADFSFSFVPYADQHFPIDARDGRILLELHREFRQLAVCDPLFRRYSLLPEIPLEDHSALPKPNWRRYREAFLVPGADDEEVDTPSFRVLYMEERPASEPPAAFVFSSGTGQWTRLAMDNYPAGMPPSDSDLLDHFFSDSDDDDAATKDVVFDRLLVLDTRSMEFSAIDIPPGPPGYFRGTRDLLIVQEVGEARIGMFTLYKTVNARKDSCIGFAVFEEGSNKWQPERIVLKLPSLRHYDLVAATDRCLHLRGSPSMDLVQSPAWDKYKSSSSIWGDVRHRLYFILR